MFFVPVGLDPCMDVKVKALVLLLQSLSHDNIPLGGREETWVPEEGCSAVSSHVVLFWDKSDPGHDSAQRPQLRWVCKSHDILL